MAHYWATGVTSAAISELGAIAAKKEKVSQMSYYLNSKHKDHANADGKMTEAQFVQKELEAAWKTADSKLRIEEL